MAKRPPCFTFTLSPLELSAFVLPLLRLKTLSDPRILAIPIPRQCMIHHIRPHYLTIGKQFQNTRKLIVCAKEQNGDENELSSKAPANHENGDGNEKEQAPFFKLRWTDLVLDPDPDNVLAVGLTGLLTWASVQVVWQFLAVSFAIVIAALKYSFVAALLIFILVALLQP
ncbi:CMP-sialic acid transporter 5 [Bienertia sinuspersici]